MFYLLFICVYILLLSSFCVFFFFKQKTAYERRISDWSSDVGSSDLTLAATYGCMGALAALHQRGKTGEGQIVDSALYEAVLQVMESTVSDYSASGTKRRRTGSALPAIAPSNVYPCRDGEYLIGANQDGVFARLAAAMGRPELASDERYATHRSSEARRVGNGVCQYGEI